MSSFGSTEKKEWQSYNPNSPEQIVSLLLSQYPQELETVLKDYQMVWLQPAPIAQDIANFVLLVIVDGKETLIHGFSRFKDSKIPSATIFYPTTLWEIIYVCKKFMPKAIYNYFVRWSRENIALGKEDLDYLVEYLRQSFPEYWGKLDTSKLLTLLGSLPVSQNERSAFSVGKR